MKGREGSLKSSRVVRLSCGRDAVEAIGATDRSSGGAEERATGRSYKQKVISYAEFSDILGGNVYSRKRRSPSPIEEASGRRIRVADAITRVASHEEESLTTLSLWPRGRPEGSVFEASLVRFGFGSDESS